MGTVQGMAHERESLERLVATEISDSRVVNSFRRIDRADFVPAEAAAVAYHDRPIPIPHDQVTSQPTLIASMVAAAAISESDRVLEVGTGYGFQTAILAMLAAHVVSIERHADLAARARDNLRRTGVTGVEIVVGDGSLGFASGAPFDAIVVSAGAPRVPEALERQLADGGRLVIPIASGFGDDVYLFLKSEGELERARLVSPARFVPLVSGDSK
jgi:protein-L-isoaspartate(D-aspartate) O-methyltransferase